MARMLRMLRKVPAYWWLLLPGVTAVIIQHTLGWPRAGQFLASSARAVGELTWRAVWAVWPLLLVALLICWLRRGWRKAVANRLRRVPRRPLLFALAGLGVLSTLAVVLIFAPTWFVPDGVIAQPQDLYRARNDVRATLLQAVAGMVLLLGAYFTYRQVQNSTRALQHTQEQVEVARASQVTDRFIRAIEQLGNENLDIRLGGIYSLERIARDSADDRITVAEVLCAYVRKHSPWPPPESSPYVADTPIGEVPTMQTRASDIQAALTVLGRGVFGTQPAWLALNSTDLRHADLTDADMTHTDLTDATLAGATLTFAHLSHADLSGADLTGAELTCADLTSVHLIGAKLIRAQLIGAKLIDTFLDGVDLTDAKLTSADLTNTRLVGATLTNAHLSRAHMANADLTSVDLANADLTNTHLNCAHMAGVNLFRADLTDADLTGADLSRASLIATNLTGAQLNSAILTGTYVGAGTTVWPEGFDWESAGVQVISADPSPSLAEGEPSESAR